MGVLLSSAKIGNALKLSGHFLHLNRIIKPWKWFCRYFNYKRQEKRFKVFYFSQSLVQVTFANDVTVMIEMARNDIQKRPDTDQSLRSDAFTGQLVIVEAAEKHQI
ncbi:hypothetical protein CLV26_106300 [Parapedobacter indicus]|nr:hypothetical protein CLV26_106300 [Parapedobacter indicus]